MSEKQYITREEKIRLMKKRRRSRRMAKIDAERLQLNHFREFYEWLPLDQF